MEPNTDIGGKWGETCLEEKVTLKCYIVHLIHIYKEHMVRRGILSYRPVSLL